ncbi:hypothetical protein CCAX7_35860 [Capsulimonas corticalis]|uniref:Uncharacterized protein n=1 Tax=Capsulimonas corticalis TaxID=2219043 RepID=A0A402D610_9BACT|nr:AAA-like domain-containing protein [Capsulimonas corticalis]BDI31535.1 hypothetical protein CCAX7_35860 [Capsulimonas corticalis]
MTPITTPAAPSTGAAGTNAFYVTGGTLGAGAASYVERRADHDLLDGLTSGDYCYVLNSRQMGKSSLCVRTMARLREKGWRTCFLDLTKFGGRNLSAEQWYTALLSEAGRELGLRAEMLAFWKANTDLGPMQRFFGAIQTVALTASESPLTVFVDEIDVTRGLPFSADEFFAGIRQCYVGRATDATLDRLTVCLLGTATPADLIQDTRTSPFNIGRRIEVRDFTLEEAAPLAAGLGKNGPALLSRVLYWTGGHPYLTQRLCRAVQEAKAQRPGDVDKLCSDLFLTRTASEADDNLAFVRNRLLKSELDLAGLLNLYSQMRRGRRIPDDEADPLCAVLKLSGVARTESGVLRVRNRIYEHVFSREWIVEHTPGAEMRRQREAYRRGLLRAGGVAASVLLVMVLLTASAIRNAQRANANARLANANAAKWKAAQSAAEWSLYAADMSLIPQAWDNNNVGRIVDALKETRYFHDRGFEWGYWNHLCHLDLMTLKGHTAPVNTVVYSPDGNRILTASNDKTAKIWDAQTGREILTIKGETNGFTSAAFSSDGSRILTASNHSDAKIWNAKTGRGMLTIKGGKNGFTSAAFSSDGTHVLTASKDGAKIWDAQTGQGIFTIKGGKSGFAFAALSPDQSRILTASDDQTIDTDGLYIGNDVTFEIWDVKTGRETLTIKAGSATLKSAAFSPDGSRIVTAGSEGSFENNNVKVWDVRTGSKLLTLKEGQTAISSVAFSPDGRRIVTGNDDNTAQVWDAQTRDELFKIKGHRDSVLSAAFSPDGKQVVTASKDGDAKIWNAQATGEALTIHGQPGGASSSPFSPDGRRIFVVSGYGAVKCTTLKVVNVQTGSVLLTLHEDKNGISSVASSPDGKRIVTTAGLGNAASVWDAITGRKLLTLVEHSGTICYSAFSPDSTRIVTANTNGATKVWDARMGNEQLTLKGEAGNGCFAAFSPDGNRIITTSWHGTVKIWDAQTGRETLTIQGNIAFLSHAPFSPDGMRVVTTAGGVFTVWDTQTGRKRFAIEGDTRYIGDTRIIYYIRFSPDGSRILTFGADNIPKVWDADQGRLLLTFKGDKQIMSGAFSHDGKRVLTLSVNGGAKIWDADQGRLLLTLKPRSDDFIFATFSSDDRHIVVATVPHIKPMASSSDHAMDLTDIFETDFKDYP